MPDQFGGLRLRVGEGLLGLAQLVGQDPQPRLHLAELLGLPLTFLVDAVQLPCPALPFGLAESGALADLPQQIGGEPPSASPRAASRSRRCSSTGRSSSREVTRRRSGESSSAGPGPRGVHARTIRTSSTVAGKPAVSSACRVRSTASALTGPSLNRCVPGRSSSVVVRSTCARSSVQVTAVTGRGTGAAAPMTVT